MKISGIPDISFNISLQLFIDGGDPDGYRIQNFQTNFNQSIDYKGQPQHEVVGGIMTLVMTQLPDASINDWMMKSTSKKNGMLIFRMGTQKPLVITFTEAYCVGYDKSFHAAGGVSTRIVISPNYISLNTKNHENFWKKNS